MTRALLQIVTAGGLMDTTTADHTTQTGVVIGTTTVTVIHTVRHNVTMRRETEVLALVLAVVMKGDIAGATAIRDLDQFLVIGIDLRHILEVHHAGLSIPRGGAGLARAKTVHVVANTESQGLEVQSTVERRSWSIASLAIYSGTCYVD
ncbi:hypothetical protein BKA67DRAFT_690821 [Truncatella angustata]|uniref:Uncharacterized protein n=1 Tax=Truncatella angustata TaxID=152316 RepID=A0A9P9A0N0_9PEZI|nr:uncharacterized protein BKA67DRAFT_690821 [Truncatella angustata]KAH6656154.1 hypothetical protein BKA67DRAFT_690821 [Truncatella angustata]